MSGSSEKAHRRDVRRVLGEQVSSQMQVLINEERELRYDVQQVRASVENLGNALMRTRADIVTLQEQVTSFHGMRWTQRLRWLVGGR